ncbi:MAG: 30S ribosomal protein S8 [Gammaproteobacteria bacterium]|jgi:small subunit ribosomal protein S8|nr:MAG: 30S ribosomal protein S8 [Gammaproteobacteria bacterium]TDJ43935.1 MAG: 30S ribosomal protein S8 [Gammaproteobacteria bacterium]
MSMTDPISDMLTRIRNGQKAAKLRVTMPASKLKVSIAKVLEAEGYLDGVATEDEENNKRTLTLTLRYHEGQPVIERIERASRPGLRLYARANELPTVQGGLGVVIVSTSNGVMTDREARAQGHGGEVLCFVS